MSWISPYRESERATLFFVARLRRFHAETGQNVIEGRTIRPCGTAGHHIGAIQRRRLLGYSQIDELIERNAITFRCFFRSLPNRLRQSQRKIASHSYLKKTTNPRHAGIPNGSATRHLRRLGQDR